MVPNKIQMDGLRLKYDPGDDRAGGFGPQWWKP